MLTLVTLTGADNKTNISKIEELSAEFPFVEWGFLIGSSFRGRFPTPSFFEELAGVQLNFSLHFCGGPLNYLLDGNLVLHPSIPYKIFQRYQLNFHGESISEKFASNLLKVEELKSHQIIVQMDGVNNWVLDFLLENGLDAVGLFDESHGAGVLPEKWPIAKQSLVGYAGGLGPENIKEQLKSIEKVSKANFWIDMETKVRTNDIFDLDKCRKVLEICMEYKNQRSLLNNIEHF